MKKIIFLTILFTGLIFALFAPLKTSAAFNANNIMADPVFNNSASMTAGQIDNWLNANFPNSCISTNRGFASPDVIGYNPSQGFLYGGNTSAGNVIAHAAQAYDLNPQVLLATLQKEQSLVSGSAGCHYETPPTLNPCPQPPYGTSASCVSACQYSGGCVYIAVGYDCPYYCVPGSTGFSKQIVKAAWKLKFVQQRSLGNYNWNIQKPGWDNSDDPATSYDGYMTQGNLKRNASSTSVYYDGYRPVNNNALSVHLDSGATAALYSYTPFTSGNSNFVSIFESWFGSTVSTNPYTSSYFSQSAYPQLNPGQQSAVYINYQNIGSATWYDDQGLSGAPGGTKPVHLATSHPLNRDSAFSAGWPSPSRPAVNFSAVYESDGTTLSSNQHKVLPGQVVRFSFNTTAPTSLVTGSYAEYFMPILEGTSGTFNDPGTQMVVTVNPSPSINWHSQSAYPTIAPSDSQTVFMKFSNSGNVPLYDDQVIGAAPPGSHPTHLATGCPLNSSSAFAETGWANSSRPGVNFAAVYESDGTTLAGNQHVALPGQVIKFNFDIKVPDGYAAGTYKLCLQPVLEGTSAGTYPDIGAFLNVVVPSKAVISYTGAPTSYSMVGDELSTFNIPIKNVGNVAVGSGATVVSTSGTSYQSSSWSGQTISNVPSLASGASTTISIPLLGPTTSSNNSDTVSFVIKDSGDSTISGSGYDMPIKLSAPQFRAAFAGQSEYPALTYAQTKLVSFSYKNTGNKPWYDDTSVSSTISTRNPLPAHLATAKPLNRGSGFVTSSWSNDARPAVNFSAVYEEDGSTLAGNQHVAQPGQIVKFTFNVSPAGWVNPGVYKEYFQPIIEGTHDGAINNVGTFQSINLLVPTYVSAYFGQSAYPSLSSGQSAPVYLMYKNNGTAPWYDNTGYSNGAQAINKLSPVHLATSRPINRSSIFNSSWPSNNRPVLVFAAVYEADGTTLASNQHVAQPGQIVKFGFNLADPSGTAAGMYREYFKPVAEGSSDGGFGDPGTYLDLTIL